MNDSSEDPRKTGLKNGLRQLSCEELQRVLSYEKEMILDAYNYADGKFCPLAVALDLPSMMKDPSNQKVIEELESRGYKVFNTRGIKGSFYTTNRLSDLLQAAKEVLDEREREV